MKPSPNEYSLVIRPPDGVIALVRDMKSQLRNYIGWFSSCDSEAHITILEFKDEDELDIFRSRITTFVSTQIPQIFRFNSFGFFGEHTFFVAPDSYSDAKISALIRHFYTYLGISAHFKPHITIGRKLYLRNQMQPTKSFFADAHVDFSFSCDEFVLRKFDGKQYSIIDSRFAFKKGI